MKPVFLAQQDIGNIDMTGVSKFIPETAEGAPLMLNTIFSQILGFLTIAAGLAFLIYFIIGAISWVTAGGDTKKVDTAKSYMTNGAIGMIIIVAAYSIIWILGQILGLSILDPGKTFTDLVNPVETPASSTNNPTAPLLPNAEHRME